jgi:hypothetical protein
LKVFISWSGESSKKLAIILHEWLPTVLQYVKPYMSSENIEKGERWSIGIATQLQETNYGIVCVTPDSIGAPWVLFESGALSKSIEHSRVSPIMFGLHPSDFQNSPLLNFQLTPFTEDEVLKLLSSINNSAPELEQVSQDILKKSFTRAWRELKDSVERVSLESPQPRGTVDHPISPSVEDAIQELLTLSRAQSKILNSPTELLPQEYLKDILGPPARVVPMSDAMWVNFQRSALLLRRFYNLVTEGKIKFDQGFGIDRDDLTYATFWLDECVTYLRERVQIEPQGGLRLRRAEAPARSQQP